MISCLRPTTSLLRSFVAASLILVLFPLIIAADNRNKGYLPYVELWVPNLPACENGTQRGTDEEFAVLWSDVGKKGKELEEAWKQARKEDPLFSRALDGLDRSDECRTKCNQASNELRKQYGSKKFSEFEKFCARRHDTAGFPWLDVDDRSLVRLCLWFASVRYNKGVDKQSGQHNWMAETSPYKDFVREGEVLTENRATEIYIESLKRVRVEQLEQRRELEKSRPISDLERTYMESHDEAEFLAALCDPYVELHRPEFLQTADNNFVESFRAAAQVRPDVLDVLKTIHQQRLSAASKPAVR